MAMNMVNVFKQEYSFSGSDCIAFVFFPGAEQLVRKLDSLHTISVSVHEAKGQARALGFRGTRGFARGVRTIAGSMILTVINDNPLRPIMNMFEEYLEWDGAGEVVWPGWSIDRNQNGVGTSIDLTNFTNMLSTLLPPFSLITQYVSEQPVNLRDSTSKRDNIAGASYLIQDIEILDEGIVTSVNDVVTEVAISFIARDFKPLSVQNIGEYTVPSIEDKLEAEYLRGVLERSQLELDDARLREALYGAYGPGSKRRYLKHKRKEARGSR